MITLSVKNLSTKKEKIECYTSLDKAKARGNEVLSSPKLSLVGASYDTNDEKAIVEELYKRQEAQNGFKR